MSSVPSLVIDTNTILDFFYFREPSSAHVFHAIKEGKACSYFTERTLAELRATLSQPKFGMDSEEVEKICAQWEGISKKSEITRNAPFPCKDPDDVKFLDLALSLAPSVLITKDKHLLKLRRRARRLEVQIMRPDEFSFEA